ncbi:MAG: group 1 glycosyl transferase [Acidobacteria bacterium]|nr:MAG: group 1 glycosyl transferase [Acidobacteriota bacterium]PYY08627.1 MAG: group 1 glycosyl transferase [Acidobacteriota bacterium]
MKICLVTAFPPSRQGLNEYGYHIARELNQHPGLTLTILGDDLPHSEPELPDFQVIRCWGFNKLSNPVRLSHAITQSKPDVVWFNIGLASFGGRPLPAFVGLAIPALTRMRGVYTHVTLHQLVETVDLKDAGVKSQKLYRRAGSIATHMLLSANSLSVLLPAYRKILQERYRRGSVYVRAHGILSGRPEYPDLSKRGNPQHRILAFGKWGTYKRLETLIGAFHLVAAHSPQARLTIAGGDHPKTPGYVASVAQRFRNDPRIKFTGYVPEDGIAPLFQSASVAVMPYSSSAGSSGVAHLACEFGVPIVASDISDFRELADEEGIAIDFYKTGDMQSLACRLLELLESPGVLEAMAMKNFSAALRMSMPEIIRQYIRSFDLQQRIKVLRAASRFRRMPRWMPLRPALRRRVGRQLASWHDTEFSEYRDTKQAEADLAAEQPPERKLGT